MIVFGSTAASNRSLMVSAMSDKLPHIKSGKARITSDGLARLGCCCEQPNCGCCFYNVDRTFNRCENKPNADACESVGGFPTQAKDPNHNPPLWVVDCIDCIANPCPQLRGDCLACADEFLGVATVVVPVPDYCGVGWEDPCCWDHPYPWPDPCQSIPCCSVDLTGYYQDITSQIGGVYRFPMNGCSGGTAIVLAQEATGISRCPSRYYGCGRLDCSWAPEITLLVSASFQRVDTQPGVPNAPVDLRINATATVSAGYSSSADGYIVVDTKNKIGLTLPTFNCHNKGGQVPITPHDCSEQHLQNLRPYVWSWGNNDLQVLIS